ncbi:hypothetical protein [Marinoscillum pacificum]|uniref:hypothetical protein n=1 Tax=Marinoscillum pacificum TaxID=392723 RepID=UPI0021574002|nr:hypothetical protein [Marinoscillum pacificum]
MKKLIHLSAIIVVTLFTAGFGCSEDESYNISCSRNFPIEEKPWLVGLITQERDNQEFAKYTYFTEATYQGNTVYTYGNCCPNCNYVRTVWNCDGEEIGVIGTQDDDIKIEDLEDETVVWRDQNTVCDL